MSIKGVDRKARRAAGTGIVEGKNWRFAQPRSSLQRSWVRLVTPQLTHCSVRSLRPIRSIHSSMPSARSCARPMKACRRRSRTIVRVSTQMPEWATNLLRRRRTSPRRLTQKDRYWTSPRSVGITAEQKLFNGFQTANRTRAAESNVFAARETLRVIEQTVLLDAATVYMDVVRDAAILEVQRSNVRVLGETLRQTRGRFKLGGGHAYRRGPGGGSARRRPIADAPRQLQPDHIKGRVSPGDRIEAGSAGAGLAGRPSVAAYAGRGDRGRDDRQSVGDGGHVRRRRRASCR